MFGFKKKVLIGTVAAMTLLGASCKKMVNEINDSANTYNIQKVMLAELNGNAKEINDLIKKTHGESNAHDKVEFEKLLSKLSIWFKKIKENNESYKDHNAILSKVIGANIDDLHQNELEGRFACLSEIDKLLFNRNIKNRNVVTRETEICYKHIYKELSKFNKQMTKITGHTNSVIVDVQTSVKHIRQNIVQRQVVAQNQQNLVNKDALGQIVSNMQNRIDSINSDIEEIDQFKLSLRKDYPKLANSGVKTFFSALSNTNRYSREKKENKKLDRTIKKMGNILGKGAMSGAKYSNIQSINEHLNKRRAELVNERSRVQEEMKELEQKYPGLKYAKYDNSHKSRKNKRFGSRRRYSSGRRMVGR